MAKLHPGTAIGAVELTVRDLERSVAFYEGTLGLRTLDREGDRATLGAGEAPLLDLHADAVAPERPRRTTGLFHFAVLVPSRPELARSLARLATARWPLTGASDHLVSEALYLNDPDGIGIEIYRDRPTSEWGWDGEHVAMATLPLDLDSILGDLDDPSALDEPVSDETRIGHVHLNVADLEDAERFWSGEIGFDVTQRGYPGALFVSAGRYHHHLGLNIWNGAGASPPPEGAIGLRRFEIVVPDRTEEAEVTDPAGVHALLRPPARNRS